MLISVPNTCHELSHKISPSIYSVTPIFAQSVSGWSCSFPATAPTHIPHPVRILPVTLVLPVTLCSSCLSQVTNSLPVPLIAIHLLGVLLSHRRNFAAKYHIHVFSAPYQASSFQICVDRVPDDIHFPSYLFLMMCTPVYLLPSPQRKVPIKTHSFSLSQTCPTSSSPVRTNSFRCPGWALSDSGFLYFWSLILLPAFPCHLPVPSSELLF